MPQQNQSQKKKKGHMPAHQNKFAFRHNPKSKKTEAILNLPNIHTCRRCHEKIEWRKQYRKYKPRTVVGKCNLCQQKKVKAAYHTICTKCTTNSQKARQLLESWKDDGDEEATRVCAICVKDPALPDPEPEDDAVVLTGKLTLRQRKTLERKLEREAQSETSKTTRPDNADEDINPMDVSSDAETDDEEDPLLQAVGGADKLLTGEAYQQNLLAKEKAKA